MTETQKIEPLFKNIVVVPHKEENKPVEKVTDTGFIISKKADTQNQPQYGKIIAIGPDVQNMKINDVVLFKEFIPAKDAYYVIRSGSNGLSVYAYKEFEYAKRFNKDFNGWGITNFSKALQTIKDN